MAIRMTGLISGMDTESIIKQLVDAQKIKNKRTTDKSDLLSFKQDKWKDLNSKLLKLYEEDLGKLRLQGNYLSKKITSSNENVISVTPSGNSTPEGTHTIEVTQTAAAQYITSTSMKNKVSLVDGKPITGDSKLVSDLGMSATEIITIETKNGKKEFEITESTTLNSFAAELKNAGITANYDGSQGRFFLGSKIGGADNYFTMATSNDSSILDRRSIHATVGYDGLSTENQAKVNNAYTVLRGTASTAADKSDAIDVLNGFAKDKVAATAKNAAIGKTLDEVKDAIKNGTTYAGQNYSGLYNELKDSMKIELRKIHDDPALDFDNPKYKKELEDMVDSEISKRAISDVIGSKDAPITSGMEAVINQKKADIIANGTTITSTGADGTITTTEIEKESEVLAKLAVNISNYTAGSAISTTGQLAKLGLTEVTRAADGKVSVADTNVVLEEAKSSKIKYNGVEYETDSNVVTLNGLTITIKGTTNGEKISLNVSNNSQETYDMIKKFVKSYNTTLAEMNSLYYATSAKGFDPLSDDERGAMSDSQIEKWEGKIKDSILRRDDTVSSIMSAMKMAANSSVKVNGKTYSLASFGIQTSSDYTEKGLLHISGDKEDSLYSDIDDKLMKAINEDPDTVMKVFSGIAQKLYDEMGDKCKGISNVRSARTFYNDKEMDKVQTTYKKQIKTLEKKLIKIEDKYYKQFAAMESALAKMQSQTNSLAGMLGS